MEVCIGEFQSKAGMWRRNTAVEAHGVGKGADPRSLVAGLLEANGRLRRIARLLVMLGDLRQVFTAPRAADFLQPLCHARVVASALAFQHGLIRHIAQHRMLEEIFAGLGKSRFQMSKEEFAMFRCL